MQARPAGSPQATYSVGLSARDWCPPGHLACPELPRCLSASDRRIPAFTGGYGTLVRQGGWSGPRSWTRNAVRGRRSGTFTGPVRADAGPYVFRRGCAGPASRRCARRGCRWRLARSASPRLLLGKPDQRLPGWQLVVQLAGLSWPELLVVGVGDQHRAGDLPDHVVGQRVRAGRGEELVSRRSTVRAHPERHLSRVERESATPDPCPCRTSTAPPCRSSSPGNTGSPEHGRGPSLAPGSRQPVRGGTPLIDPGLRLAVADPLTVARTSPTSAA